MGRRRIKGTSQKTCQLQNNNARVKHLKIGKVKAFLFKSLLVGTFCFGGEIAVFAQDASEKVIDIQEVSVYSTRKYYRGDCKVTQPDSLDLLRSRSSNLSQLLAQTTPIVIKSYGSPGSLSSVSFRGTGSNHTQISWNGISMNSLCSGDMNLSLVPVLIADQISVVYGAPASVFGSGTFGGAIDLSNTPDWNNKFSLAYSNELGSYGNFCNAFKLKAGSRKFQYTALAYRQKAENNFEYTDPYNVSVEQKHNYGDQLGFMQQAAWRITPSQQLEAGMWYQQEHKELPSLADQSTPSNKYQADSSLRMYAVYSVKFDKSIISARSAWFTDGLHYTDKTDASAEVYSIDSKIGGTHFNNELTVKNQISQFWAVDGGLFYNKLQVETNNYNTGTKNENELAAAVAARYNKPGYLLQLSARKDWITGYDPKPQFAAGGKINFFDSKLALRGNISTRFRRPTFNERYWLPGGNPDLKPESGWGSDLGVDYKFESLNKANSLKTGVALYHNLIDNWIQWISVSSSESTPVSYKKVWARGIESNAEYQRAFAKGWLKLYGAYQYTRSTILSTEDNNKEVKGKQLMYVPIHTASGSLSVKYQNFDAEYSTQYTGYRYTDENNGGFLKSYCLSNIAVGYVLKYKTHNMRFDFRIMNLFDNSYQAVKNYAMPGRTFNVGLLLQLRS
jgi:outer membrane cobalamin receptor